MCPFLGQPCSPPVPSDKWEMISGCFPLHCSSQEATAPHWKLLWAPAKLQVNPKLTTCGQCRGVQGCAEVCRVCRVCRGVQGCAEAACSSLHSLALQLPLSLPSRGCYKPEMFTEK